MLRTIVISALVFFTTQIIAQPTQTIRGTVLDKASSLPLAFVNVVVLDTKPFLAATSDTAGNFTISDVPVGRYEIQVSFIGYESAIIREVVVNSAKQTFLTIQLKENIHQLKEVTIKPQDSKEKPLNSMATVSARMFSVEEANRYAGGFDDPARLASSFAGVASNTAENGIIVRGNAPKYVQWKMEGVEVPNPNHFGDLKAFGGGLFTALSSQMLANSDFFTGAFPAEYNNALSGVFDMSMRAGNNQKQENTFQIGAVGIEASSEGPFKKGGRSSYLFNYRYSTLSLLKPLLPEDANTIKFQDLSFKLNFPTKKAGVFSVWGIGLTDNAGSKPKTDSTKWEYYDDRCENIVSQYTGAAGISNKYFFKNGAFLKTTLAATTNSTSWTTEKQNDELALQPQSKIANRNQDYVFSTVYTRKVNPRHTKKSGILIKGMAYDILLNKSMRPGAAPEEIVNAGGFSTLISGFSSSSISLTDKTILNLGITSQVFTLNNNKTLEPRIGLSQQIGKNKSIAFAYGLHSRLEQLNFYFNNSLSTGEKMVNKDLDFTKAHHFVLSYDWNITDLIHLKVEPYYQRLFSVPVIADSSYSILNIRNELFFAGKLQNTGEGKNYGMDITLEKYISDGYYYMFTASLFGSEYKGGDNVWRSTRFNRNFVFNLLVGKEWKLGNSDQNVFSLNSRFVYQGGNRYSPVNEAATSMAKEIVYDETRAYSMQAASTLNVHFTASYKMNRKNGSSEVALKILNVTGQADFEGFKYNQRSNSITKDLTSIIIPNLSYKIQF